MHRLEARRIFLTTVFLHYSGKDSFSHLMLQFTIFKMSEPSMILKLRNFQSFLGYFFK